MLFLGFPEPFLVFFFIKALWCEEYSTDWGLGFSRGGGKSGWGFDANLGKGDDKDYADLMWTAVLRIRSTCTNHGRICAAVELLPRLSDSWLLIAGDKCALGIAGFDNNFGGVVGAGAGAGLRENQTSILGGLLALLGKEFDPLLDEPLFKLDASTGAG